MNKKPKQKIRHSSRIQVRRRKMMKMGVNNLEQNCNRVCKHMHIRSFLTDLWKQAELQQLSSVYTAVYTGRIYGPFTRPVNPGVVLDTDGHGLWRRSLNTGPWTRIVCTNFRDGCELFDFCDVHGNNHHSVNTRREHWWLLTWTVCSAALAWCDVGSHLWGASSVHTSCTCTWSSWPCFPPRPAARVPPV